MSADRPVLWTAAAAAAATNGDAGGDWRATGVSIDSRTVEPGDLFVALAGPNFDGHDYAARALEAGAAAAILARRPAGLPPDAPVLMVHDTLAALQDLGRVARLESHARIAAVTGSVGKTGTKAALAACLGAQAPCYAAAGSLNNHWGVPLSLARLPALARYGVFELGMNHAGEIRELTRQVRPDVAIITTIEPAHMEFFDSVEAVADAKAEIFEGMTADGTAVLNRDNPHFARLVAAARTAGLGRILSFGAAAGADARLVSLDLDADGCEVVAEIQGRRLVYRLGMPGRHSALNSLAVLLAVDALGADVAQAARTLADLTPLKGRGARSRIRLAAGGAATLIDDSYNASPVAVRAALDVLGRVEPGPGGRRIAVLGDMLELGDRGPALHADLAGAVADAGVDLAFCCGPLMRHLHDRLTPSRRGGHAADSAALAPLVTAALRAGDVVLVKGSLGSRMARVVEAIQGLDRGGNGDGNGSKGASAKQTDGGRPARAGRRG